MAIPNPSKPLYDTKQSYLDNATMGPFFEGPLPPRSLPASTEWVNFLGFQVASRIGVAAGPLLNSRWVALAAQLGYDILTYKTIRSYEDLGHSAPNIIHVDTGGPLFADELPDSATATPPTNTLDQLAITNSFGNPSRSPVYLAQDLPKAQEACGPGQALVISVFGTPASGRSLLDDFCTTTRLAVDNGAQILEANFSCPNVAGSEGSLYESLSAIETIGRAVCQTAQGRPVILKMGPMLNEESLRGTLLAAARAGFQAVSGINTVRMKVVTPSGAPALGPQRLYSGVCGSPIRPIGLEFVRKARTIIDQEHLDLTLIGVGGITSFAHFAHYLDAGADFAQTATGMMWDPSLAAHHHKEYKLCPLSS